MGNEEETQGTDKHGNGGILSNDTDSRQVVADLAIAAELAVFQLHTSLTAEAGHIHRMRPGNTSGTSAVMLGELPRKPIQSSRDGIVLSR